LRALGASLLFNLTEISRIPGSLGAMFRLIEASSQRNSVARAICGISDRLSRSEAMNDAGETG
jgi:hypothetical protein